MKVICDIGSNFNPLLKRSSLLRMFQAANNAGADGVKLQCFHPLDQIVRPLEWKERCAPWTLSFEEVRVAGLDAKARGLEFWCTPFTLEAVQAM